MNKNTTSSDSIGFGGALLLLFIALKLTGVIDWSWWWVLSPAWIGLVVILFGILLVVLIYVIKELVRRNP